MLAPHPRDSRRPTEERPGSARARSRAKRSTQKGYPVSAAPPPTLDPVKPRFTAAAGLALAIFAMGSLVLVGGAKGRGAAAVHHTCSVTDRQFIGAAQLNMAALGSLSEDYLHGDARPADVIDQTRNAVTG